ncbi:hypothetical protein [Agaribacterium haliotis]|uniref:hypothetical protein n=1 Tax=Agaribacterium haliotis TaxID=2013869 RepID=UPI000BB5408D|nr:hypothetical protein [Agaribacterium haliotis]
MHAGRADLSILEFSGHPGLRRYATNKNDGSDIVLAPIPGLKIALPDERVFAVSKHAPNSAEVLKALNLGLKTMREKNLIRPLMRRTGMLSDTTADWHLVNASTSTKKPVKSSSTSPSAPLSGTSTSTDKNASIKY